jgi:hypothetical protein
MNLLTLGIASRVHADTPSHSEGRSRLSSGEVVHVCTESLRGGKRSRTPLILELINERKGCTKDFSKC